MMGSFLSWRFGTAGCAMIPILGHLLMMLVPESPTYLMGKGRQKEAKEALMWLRGAKFQEEIDSELVDVSI